MEVVIAKSKPGGPEVWPTIARSYVWRLNNYSYIEVVRNAYKWNS